MCSALYWVLVIHPCLITWPFPFIHYRKELWCLYQTVKLYSGSRNLRDKICTGRSGLRFRLSNKMCQLCASYCPQWEIYLSVWKTTHLNMGCHPRARWRVKHGSSHVRYNGEASTALVTSDALCLTSTASLSCDFCSHVSHVRLE